MKDSTLFFDLKKVEDFSKFMDALAEYRSSHISNTSSYLDMKTCLEELIVNIFQHGGFEGTRKEPSVHVKLYKEDNEVVAEVTDNANPFNLLTSDHVADVSSPLEERPIGGLGIHLIKKLSDRLEYVPVKHGNKVLLAKGL